MSEPHTRISPRVDHVATRALTVDFVGESFVPDPDAVFSIGREGDLVVGVDDSPVTSAESLVGLVHARRIDTQVELTVVRDGREEQVTATLGTAPTAQG